ncbi:MAG: hypothetical protein LBS21_06440 [Clostridiales bacterium]|nr:hypothetical protein [Clostridiales bacterium]
MNTDNKSPEHNRIFSEESSHLSKTIDAIKQKINDTNAAMPSINLYAVAYSWEERDEMRYDKGRKSKMIEQVKDLKALIPNPYFFRMDLFNGKNEMIMYIGHRGFETNGYRVYDWRTPVAFKHQGKETEFLIGNHKHKITLKRRFDISNSTLRDYSDEFETRKGRERGVTDPFLLRLLKEKRNEKKLTDIIKTIQANQGAIIEFDINKGFVVQGCAGSGKTMIMLHRLSYIKYNNPSLKLENVKIITSNKLFNVYINPLSRDLELDNIEILSVKDYYLYILNKYEQQDENEYINNCKQRDGYVFLDKEKRENSNYTYQKQYENLSLASDYGNQELIDFIYSETFKEQCIKQYGSYTDNLASSINFYNCERICTQNGYKKFEISKSGRSIIFQYKDYLLGALSTNNARRAENRMRRKDLFSSDEVRVLESAANKLMDTRSIFNKTVNYVLIECGKQYGIDFRSDKKREKFYRYHLYVHLLFWTLFRDSLPYNDRDHYLHIDEGQDISLSEYDVFSNANGGNVIFNIYGDINQRITLGRGIGDWKTMKNQGFVDEIFSLNENYRNSIEITDYCNTLFGFNSIAIGIHESPVRLINLQTAINELWQLDKKDNRVAFISKDYETVDKIKWLFGNSSGITFLTVVECKGMEYDVVYVLDEGLTANEQYVAFTRSLNKLIIVSHPLSHSH